MYSRESMDETTKQILERTRMRQEQLGQCRRSDEDLNSADSRPNSMISCSSSASHMNACSPKRNRRNISESESPVIDSGLESFICRTPPGVTKKAVLLEDRSKSEPPHNSRSGPPPLPLSTPPPLSSLDDKYQNNQMRRGLNENKPLPNNERSQSLSQLLVESCGKISAKLSSVVLIKKREAPVSPLTSALNVRHGCGKVAALADCWEKEILQKTPKYEKRQKPTTPTISSLDRSRIPVSSGSRKMKSIENQQSTEHDSSQSRMSKLRNKWERATRTGQTINPDESLINDTDFSNACKSSSMSSTVDRHAVQNVIYSTLPSRKVAVIYSKSSQMSQNSAPTKPSMENLFSDNFIEPSKFDTEATPVTSTISKASNFDTEAGAGSAQRSPQLASTRFSSVEVMASPSSVGSALTEEHTYSSEDLNECLNDVIRYAEHAARSPYSLNSTLLSAKSINDSEVTSTSRSSSRLFYTISAYRKQEESNKTPRYRQTNKDYGVKLSSKSVTAPDSTHARKRPEIGPEIGKAIAVEQEHIFQASSAIKYCKSNPDFTGSREEIDAERALLVATETRRCLLDEQSRWCACCANKTPFDPTPPFGTVTVHGITIKKEFVSDYLRHQSGDMFNFICLLKYRQFVRATQITEVGSGDMVSDLIFSDFFKFEDLPLAFKIQLELYVLTVKNGTPNSGKSFLSTVSKTLTIGKKRCRSKLFSGVAHDSQLAKSVLKSNFELAAQTTLDISYIGCQKMPLKSPKFFSPVENSLQLILHVNMNCSCLPTMRGYLNLLEEVDNQSAWRRVWCALESGVMKFWTYEELEQKEQPPSEYLQLKMCASSIIGPPPEAVTARAHSFAFRTTEDILHVFSAESAEACHEWCEKLNECLETMRLTQRN